MDKAVVSSFPNALKQTSEKERAGYHTPETSAPSPRSPLASFDGASPMLSPAPVSLEDADVEFELMLSSGPPSIDSEDIDTEKLADVDSDLIPTVDLSKPAEEVLAQIQQAADSGGPGFFYLVNHGIPQTVFDEAISAAHVFYTGKSSEEKRAFSCTHTTSNSTALGAHLQEKLCIGAKGYVKPGQEGAYKKDAATDVRPDDEQESNQRNTRESFVLRYPNWRSDGDAISSQPYTDVLDYAQWRKEWEATHSTGPPAPVKDDMSVQETIQLYGEASKFFFLADQDCPEEFDPAVSVYLREMRELSQQMMKYFVQLVRECNPESQDLKIDSDMGMSTFNITHYPPKKENANKSPSFGISDHTDWELFTLLYPSYLQQKHLDLIAKEQGSSHTILPNNPNICSETGISFTGLEVWFNDRWVHVPHRPGSLIVNQGEMMSRLTNGRFAAPVHRVSGNNPLERYSLVSFWAPNYETPLPDPVQGTIPAGEHYVLRNQMLEVVGSP